MRQRGIALRPIFASTLRLALAAGLLAAVLPTGAVAQAQTELPRDRPGVYERPQAAKDAIDQIKSPYCPGMMLEVCSSLAGAALRDSISRLAEEGWTTEQLVDWVVANHGEEYRALPKAEGRSLVAWVVPPLGALVGLLVVILTLKALKKQRIEVAPIEGELSDEEEARLKAAMKELDKEEEATFF